MRNSIFAFFAKKKTGVPKMENMTPPPIRNHGWEQEVYDPMTIRDSVEISLRNTKWQMQSLEDKIEKTKKYLDSWQKQLDSELQQLENYKIQKERFEEFLNIKKSNHE